MKEVFGMAKRCLSLKAHKSYTMIRFEAGRAFVVHCRLNLDLLD
jgi:hypothetical protein